MNDPRSGNLVGFTFKTGIGIGLVSLIPSSLGNSMGIHRIKEPSPFTEGFWDGPSQECSIRAGNIPVLRDFRDMWDELWAAQEQQEPPVFQSDHLAGKIGKMGGGGKTTKNPEIPWILGTAVEL